MGRRLVFALVVLVVGLTGVVATPSRARAAEPSEPTWIRPVPGAVARPFDPPRTQFGAGHLGVDLIAAPGTPVRSAGLGVVAFAGSVAGTLHVVVVHPGDLRTSYSFLATVAVRRGQLLVAGEVVGTSGGRGEGHDGSVVHFGLRSGDTYVDPMVLFGPLDLTTVVHLAPTSIPPRPAGAANERRGLIAGLAHDIGATIHAAGTVAGAAGRGAAALSRAEVRTLRAALPLPTAAVDAVTTWIGQHGSCDPHAPAADGEGGSDHRVMMVAGIESSLTGTQSSMSVPASALGYAPDEVTYFSYAANGGDYTPADTEEPIMVAARRLGEQLRALQRREPGREVDLLAHSQGGVVVEAFLTQVYDRDDRSYPPLGTVVTLSSPLRGDPLATAVAAIERSRSGNAALSTDARIAQVFGVRLPIHAPALRDLAAESDLMRKLDAARWPEEVQLTAIGSATDFVVPGNAASRPGAHGVTVVASGLNAHTAILDDPSAMRVVRAALDDAPFPCQSLATLVVAKVVPVAIRSVEDDAGRIGESLGRVQDTQR